MGSAQYQETAACPRWSTVVSTVAVRPQIPRHPPTNLRPDQVQCPVVETPAPKNKKLGVHTSEVTCSLNSDLSGLGQLLYLNPLNMIISEYSRRSERTISLDATQWQVSYVFMDLLCRYCWSLENWLSQGHISTKWGCRLSSSVKLFMAVE